jgi:hypothetical protein
MWIGEIGERSSRTSSWAYFVNASVYLQLWIPRHHSAGGLPPVSKCIQSSCPCRINAYRFQRNLYKLPMRNQRKRMCVQNHVAM